MNTSFPSSLKLEPKLLTRSKLPQNVTCKMSSKKMDGVHLSLPVCYSLFLAILGESHEAAIKLCRVCCGLINKVQLTFPCHNVLQHKLEMIVLKK